MKKYIFVIGVFILFLISLIPDDTPAQEIEWNEFVWAESIIEGKYYKKAALLIPSWGDMIQLKGARSESDWKIGDLTIEKPLIFYEPSGLENFNLELIQADGLLGNAIFYDNHIITIDLRGKRFGIMEVKP